MCVLSVIASNIDYHKYQPWNNGSTVNAIQTLFDGQEQHMSVNNTILVFPQTDVVQSYELSIGIQLAARYPMNTILSGFSRPAPNASRPGLMKDVAEAAGRGDTEVIKDPLIGMLGGYQKKI